MESKISREPIEDSITITLNEGQIIHHLWMQMPSIEMGGYTHHPHTSYLDKDQDGKPIFVQTYSIEPGNEIDLEELESEE